MENKPNVKKDRRIVKTRRAIKLALIDIMKKKDISEITISELSKRADVNRKTFYAHYPNVNAVFSDIEDEIIGTMRELLLKEKNSGYREPARFFLTLNRLLNENFEFYKNIFRLDNSVSFLNKIKELIKETALRDAVAKLKMPEEYSNLITEFLVGGFVSMYIEWFYSKRTVSIETLANTAGALVEEISAIVNRTNTGIYPA